MDTRDLDSHFNALLQKSSNLRTELIITFVFLAIGVFGLGGCTHAYTLPSVEPQPATIDGKFFFACLKPYKQELRMGVRFSFMNRFFWFHSSASTQQIQFRITTAEFDDDIHIVSGACACELAFFLSRYTIS